MSEVREGNAATSGCVNGSGGNKLWRRETTQSMMEREKERENINEGKICNYVINSFFYFVLFLIKNVKLD
jgi:hypothetical protein